MFVSFGWSMYLLLLRGKVVMSALESGFWVEYDSTTVSSLLLGEDDTYLNKNKPMQVDEIRSTIGNLACN